MEREEESVHVHAHYSFYKCKTLVEFYNTLIQSPPPPSP